MAPHGGHRWILATALIAVFLAAPLDLAVGAPQGRWTVTTDYPANVAGESCVVDTGQIYCIGGVDRRHNSHDAVYDAYLTPSGIGSWSPGHPYPTSVDGESCVTVTAGVYCIGGEDASTVLDQVNFAPSSPSGLGHWSGAAPYPIPVSSPACVSYSGYVYCVGGFDRSGDEVNSTYYASVLSGLRGWSATSQYPVPVDSASCTVFEGDVYCFAGETETPSSKNHPITSAYSAPLGPSGIGEWSEATPYPAALAALSCAQYSGRVYCVGGFDESQRSRADSNFGAISASGAGPWREANSYPVPIDSSSCVAAAGYLYCVAGMSVTDNGTSVLASAYFAPAWSASEQTSGILGLPTWAAVLTALALGLVVAAVLIRVRSPGPVSGP